MPDLDRISFVAKPSQPGDRSGGIRILINGEDLGDLVAAHELPYAKLEGRPQLAGEYSGLTDRHVYPASQYFLGKLDPDDDLYKGKIQLLGCECGEPGCWPLVCRIEVSDDRVVWSEFEQPYRTGTRGRSIWSYEGFGPFVFDRAQYEAALETLRR